MESEKSGSAAENTFAPKLPLKRVPQRPTVTTNLTSSIDFLLSSPTPRVARDAAHVTCSADVSEDFGYPHSSPKGETFNGFATQSPTNASEKSRCFPVGPSIPLKPSFTDELRLATAWTPSTAATPSATPQAWPEPIRSLRLPAPAARSPAPSPSLRRSLAELDLLVAEAESKVRNLELGHPRMAHPNFTAFEESIQSAEKALQLAQQRARVLESQHQDVQALPQRMHLAAMRASIAQLDLRLERFLSNVAASESAPSAPSAPAPSMPATAAPPEIRTDACDQKASPSESAQQMPPSEELMAKYQKVEAELEKAQVQIEELRKEKAELIQLNQKLEQEKEQRLKDQDDLKKVLQELDVQKAARQKLEVTLKGLQTASPATAATPATAGTNDDKAPQTGELLVKSANDRELSAPSEISISGANIANRVEGSEGSAS